MKKIFLIIVLVFFVSGFSQKKKTYKKSTITNNLVLAKLDLISAELITIKNQKKLVLFIISDKIKDTLEVRKNVSNDFKPLNFTLKSFQTKGKKIYYIQWEEKNKIKTKLKQEDKEIFITQIWNIETKELLLDNTQSTNHIVETVYLDKNKTASETQEKIRREGFEFELLSNGDFILKNKSQNDTFTFDTTTLKYILLKGVSPKKTKKR